MPKLFNHIINPSIEAIAEEQDLKNRIEFSYKLSLLTFGVAITQLISLIYFKDYFSIVHSLSFIAILIVSSQLLKTRHVNFARIILVGSFSYFLLGVKILYGTTYLIEIGYVIPISLAYLIHTFEEKRHVY